MITFAVLAFAMVALATALVVWPLLAPRLGGGPAREAINVALYRDRLAELEAERDSGTLPAEQFEQARVELQRDLLENAAPEAPTTLRQRQPRSAVLLVVVVPLLAGSIYFWLGAPDFITVERVAPSPSTSGNMDEAVARLRARLAANPDDLAGWRLLGRSLMVQQQYQAAADAYAQAMQQVGEQAELLALYAEALAMVQGRVSGQPEALARRALTLDPDNLIALWLAGYAAGEQGDFATAVMRWERLEGLLPADGSMAKRVQESLAEARQQLGTPTAVPQAAADATGAIHVSIRLDESLRTQLAAQAVLFVYVQDPEGGRMPIASVRRVAALPADVVLDDSTVLQPGRRLSDLPALKIVARIAQSGAAATRSGDLYGEVRVPAGTGEVTILIDRVVP